MVLYPGITSSVFRPRLRGRLGDRADAKHDFLLKDAGSAEAKKEVADKINSEMGELKKEREELEKRAKIDCPDAQNPTLECLKTYASPSLLENGLMTQTLESMLNLDSFSGSGMNSVRGAYDQGLAHLRNSIAQARSLEQFDTQFSTPLTPSSRGKITQVAARSRWLFRLQPASSRRDPRVSIWRRSADRGSFLPTV